MVPVGDAVREVHLSPHPSRWRLGQERVHPLWPEDQHQGLTDEKEDNDSADEATPAPTGDTTYSLTLFPGDPDFFDVGGLTASCTVSYQPVHPEGTDFTVNVLNAAASGFRTGVKTNNPDGSRTIVISLAPGGSAAKFVSVQAHDTTKPCQPYTIHCM